MKRWRIFSLLAALAGLALLIGCKPAAATNWAASTDCKACHSGETSSTYGLEVIANEATYAQSGHYNGPRVDTTLLAATAGEHFTFEGSDAMYDNGSDCSKCHTDQGFVSWLANPNTTNTSTTFSAASPPGCFTCHAPHETGDFSLRNTSPVTLQDQTTTYNYGKGNFCVNCHQNLNTPASTLKGYAVTAQSPVVPVMSWGVRTGPHHGDQSDFIMAANFSHEGANSYLVSKHVTAAGAPQDSCVGCHEYQPTTDLRGSLQLGGHGFYLMGDVHNSIKYVTALCQNCHNTGSNYTVFTGPTGHPAASDWGGLGHTSDMLLEIQDMRNILIGYFATAANFAAGGALILTPAGTAYTMVPAPAGSNEWNRDWVFTSATVQVTQNQSQALWNLHIFMEDRSNGIHNPTGAAQLLWDSIDMLHNDPLHPGVAASGNRPPN